MEVPASSVSEQESQTTFESQAKDEKLILLMRAHFITNVPWIFITLVLAALPLLLPLGGVVERLANEFNIPGQSIDGFVLIWYLLVFAYGFQSFLNWYFNIYILTDRRIVDLDFFQLLYKRLSSAHLNNIEDVTVSMGGVAQAVFHYGDIHIQTAGTVTNFEFHRVPNPSLVKQLIEAAITEDRKTNGVKE